MGPTACFWGPLSPFLGSHSPFLGSLSLFLGSLTRFLGSPSPFLGSLSPFLGSHSPFLGSPHPGVSVDVLEVPEAGHTSPGSPRFLGGPSRSPSGGSPWPLRLLPRRLRLLLPKIDPVGHLGGQENGMGGARGGFGVQGGSLKSWSRPLLTLRNRTLRLLWPSWESWAKAS